MIMKFIVNQTVFTEKQKGNQFFTMDTHIYIYSEKILKSEKGKHSM